MGNKKRTCYVRVAEGCFLFSEIRTQPAASLLWAVSPDTPGVSKAQTQNTHVRLWPQITLQFLLFAHKWNRSRATASRRLHPEAVAGAALPTPDPFSEA